MWEQVEFSPFNEDRVAVATAQHFGLVGNGRLHVVHRTAVSGELSEVYVFGIILSILRVRKEKRDTECST